MNEYYRVLEKYRDSIALHAPDGSMTFDELDVLSDDVGSILIKSGCKECLIFQEPSAIYIASLVACMKTGIPALIIDPEQRNAQVFVYIKNRKRACCLTSPTLKSKAEKSLGVPVIPIDKRKSSNSIPVAEFNSEITDLMPLHRVFTSGSSGLPKMVTINRESEYIHAKETREIYNYKAGETYANIGRHTSSLIVNGFWRVLLAGGCFVLFDLKKVSFSIIYEKLKLYEVRGLQGPSSILKKFIHETHNLGKLDKIDHVIFGGEPLPTEILATANQFFSQNVLITLNYSSTETMLVSYHTLPINDALNLKIIPAGVPTPSKSIKLINELGDEVEDGLPGRVIVTSKYIASSIDGDKPDTLIETEGKPGYRTFFTSDLGRWNHEGHLELLGRMDRVIKVNGVRVEINHIEDVLNQLPGISKSIVVPIDLSKRSRQLFACVVRSNKTLSNSEIYDVLEKTLNTAHLPAHIVDLKSIPLNLRGKTDLKKIKELCKQHLLEYKRGKSTSRSKVYIEVQNILVEFWSQALKKPITKRSGSFFSEGGDSLASAELVTMINSEYNLDLQVIWVFKHPTIQKQTESLLYSTSELSGETDNKFNKLGDRSDLSVVEIKQLLGF